MKLINYMMNGKQSVKLKNNKMEYITKEEMVEILKDNIDWLRKDVSDPYHDIRDYERLEDDDYDYISENIIHNINEILTKRRSLKIEKIKERL